MDFGGIRGQYLSDQVVQMYNEFTELTNTFQSRGDNPLDTTNTVSVIITWSTLVVTYKVPI